MNNIYLDIVKTLVRVLIVWLTGMLYSHLSPSAYNVANDIITKLGGTEAVVIAVAGFLGALGWSLWTRLASRVHLNTALNLPKGSTTDDVKINSPSPMSALTNPTPK